MNTEITSLSSKCKMRVNRHQMRVSSQMRTRVKNATTGHNTLQKSSTIFDSQKLKETADALNFSSTIKQIVIHKRKMPTEVLTFLILISQTALSVIRN